MNCVYLIFMCLMLPKLTFQTNFHTSVYTMSHLVQIESFLLNKMSNYVTQMDQKLKFLKMRLNEFQNSHNEAVFSNRIQVKQQQQKQQKQQQIASHNFENSINNYLLIKRLTTDWPLIENVMTKRVGEDLMEFIQSKAAANKLPSDVELIGTIEGLLRIQDFYRLDAEDIANGLLQNVQYDTKLDADLCYEIGNVAHKENKYKLAFSWYKAALVRCAKNATETKTKTTTTSTATATTTTLTKNITQNVTDVELSNVINEQKILFALEELKNNISAKNTDKQQQTMEEFFVALLELSDKMEKQQQQKQQQQQQQQETQRANIATDVTQTIPFENMLEKIEEIAKNQYNNIDNITNLQVPLSKENEKNELLFTCNGLLKPTAADERNLFCAYISHTHPFLKIAPFKVEGLHFDPLLLLFHDVISDNEINELIQLSKNRMTSAQIIINETTSAISKLRTSQVAILEKNDFKIFETIDRRVEDMTFLNMNYAEDFQIANYGIGGHYVVHTDFFSRNCIKENKYSKMGDRIATVLFYLTDVEQGGGTAFPYAKRLILPKKGAAAFWYNLHANGKADGRTLHGACPIISGSKWVLNRWIHEYFQDDRRPCDLRPDI